MDMSEKEKYGMEKGEQEHLNYPQSGISTDWRFGNPQAMSMVAANTSMPQGHQIDSFCSTLWDHPSNSQSLGFSETIAAHNVLVRKPVPGSSTHDMGGGTFLQATAGVLSPGLSQFPADTAFIERAARFSCFGGGNFGAMVSHFGLNQPIDPYMNATKPVPGAQPQKSDVNTGEASKDAIAVSADHGSNGGSPMTSQKDVGAPGNESGEAELSGSGQEENLNFDNSGGEPSSKTLAAKKRKRNTQEMEIDQTRVESGKSAEDAKENAESRLKAEQNNSTVATIKPNGKQGKDGTESPKEDYIHVRARRGQATNSHSLAERVRREKISERMKFLQDLVPGCSKVTGKAVMLDEIINYVQSLQRQVEFLSMKLATVNPQLDFNIEGLLSKDILQSRSSPSSTIGFSPDLALPLMHQNSHGLVQSGISGMGGPSDALRRAINAQMTSMHTFKESKHQMSSTWDEEFHNAMQIGFVGNPPLNIQDLNGKNQDGFPL